MLKAKIEAILFLTDKPMRAQAIARIVNADVQVVRQAILELVHDYEERQGGLEIADDNGYIIQVKDEYSAIIDEFVPMEMPIALVRTLSAIAIKQPVAQSEIIKIRGAGAYEHIKELVERELIIKKEDGRSPMLSTTKKFQEYFRLSHDAKSLRNELRKDEKKEQAPVEGSEVAVQLPIETTALQDFAPAASVEGDAAVAEPADLVAQVVASEAPAVVAELQDESDSEVDEEAEAAAAESEEDDCEDEKPPTVEELEQIFEASPDASFVYRPGNKPHTADSESEGTIVPPQTETVDPPTT